MKILKALVILFCFALFLPQNALAKGLGGGATEMTQLLNNAELATQVSQLYEQISNQIKMIQDMVLNTKQLGTSFFDDLKGSLDEVRGAFDGIYDLSYTLSNLDEELRKKLPGYDAIDISSTSVGIEQARDILEMQEKMSEAVAKTLGMTAEDIQDDLKTLEKIQQKSTTVQGRNEIMGVMNQLAAFQGEQLVKLRDFMVMQQHQINTNLDMERAEKAQFQKVMEESEMKGLNKDSFLQAKPVKDRR